MEVNDGAPVRDTFMDRLRSASLQQKSETKPLSSSVKQLLRQGLSLSEVKRVTLHALGSSENQGLEHNVSTSTKTYDTELPRKEEIHKISVNVKKRGRAGYDGGRSEQVLDAAWRMFFDAQGPNQPEPETEDDIACQLEYINVARIEHKRRAGEAKERTAYSTYQTRYLKYGRNNSLFLPEVGLGSEDMLVEQLRSKRRRQ